MPSFDTIARIYEPLERICFAGKLHASRMFCIAHLRNCKTGLLIGDGDGRFSSQLLDVNPDIVIDSIDLSRKMLDDAQRRAGVNAERLRCIHADALEFQYPTNRYNFIGLHYCLDCFDQNEAEQLTAKLFQALAPSGVLVHTDFQTQRTWHTLVVGVLYLFFRLFAGINVRKLPIVAWGDSLELVGEKEYLGRLVFSRVYRKRGRC